MPEKYHLSIEKAKKNMQTADHLAYITFPLVKENRLLVKILEEIYLSLINIISAVLQYEYLYKRITLYTNPRDNFITFKKISLRYHINEEQMRKITEILSLYEKHKKSPFEFAKNDKIVIMSEGLRTDTLNLEKIKNFLLETKDIIRKISSEIRKKSI